MNGPYCYNCGMRPALALESVAGRWADRVLFCSVECAASYAVAFVALSDRRWCRDCSRWTHHAGGRCVPCSAPMPARLDPELDKLREHAARLRAQRGK